MTIHVSKMISWRGDKNSIAYSKETPYMNSPVTRSAKLTTVGMVEKTRIPLPLSVDHCDVFIL